MNNSVQSTMRINLNESTLDQTELDNVIALFKTNQLTMGAQCEAFEKAFSQLLGVKHAIMVNSGSSANLLVFFAIANPISNQLNLLPSISPGSEIIVPALTWPTSVWPIIQIGCVPVFVDSNPYTLQMDLDSVEAAMTSKTKAICAPHILGNAIDIPRLQYLAEKHGVWLIEDACESLGVKNHGKFAGTAGNFGTYSFYFSHHITTIEGGMVVTNHDGLADLMRGMRAHGWVRHRHDAALYVQQNPELDSRFLFVSTGFNMRPTEINAVLGITQLKKLVAFNEKRNFIHKTWDAAFKTIQNMGQLTCIEITEGTDPALFGYPVLCKNKSIRTKLQIFLEKNQIETRPIICGNLTRQPALKHHFYKIHGELIGANQVMDCGLYWGMHPMMHTEQINYVIDKVLEFFNV